MKLALEAIKIGERRREDMGDLDGLASSLAKHGLLHPVVVDNDGNLVAGRRRLSAAQRLGWVDIEVRPFGDLTLAERQELELEENLRRKDLTPYERNKTVVSLAETATEVLREQTKMPPPQSPAPPEPDTTEQPSLIGESPIRLFRPPAKPDSQEKVAERINISPRTLSDAQRHVYACERYPQLKPWSQDVGLRAAAAFERYPALVPAAGGSPKQAITMGETLDSLATEERTDKLTLLAANDSNTIAYLAGLPPIPEPSEATKEAEKRYRQLLGWRKALERARRLLMGLDDRDLGVLLHAGSQANLTSLLLECEKWTLTIGRLAAAARKELDRDV